MDFSLSEEDRLIQDTVRDFTKKELIPLERDILGREPEDAVLYLPKDKEEELKRKAKEMGFWALNVPEELGGGGLSTLQLSIVEEEVSKSIIPFNFGDVNPILFECEGEKREKYLIPSIEGEKVGRVAIVDEEKTRARKVNGGYLIDGTKLIIAPDSGDFLILFAELDGKGMTCFLVDKEEGLEIKEEDRKGWMARFIKPIPVILRGFKVSEESLLGEEGGAYKLGREYLPKRRIIRGARFVGACERILDISVEYVKNWETFGKTLSERMDARFRIGEMMAEIEAGRYLVYKASWKADRNEDVRMEGAKVKVFCSEMLSRVSERAFQIHGGPSFQEYFPMRRLLRNIYAEDYVEHSIGLQKLVLAKHLLETRG